MAGAVGVAPRWAAGIALVMHAAALAIEVSHTQGQLTKAALAQAEFIYAGTAMSVVAEETVPAPKGLDRDKGVRRTVAFRVDHCIKGPPAREIRVRFFVPDDYHLRLRYPPIPLRSRCLLALAEDKGAKGTYGLWDPEQWLVLLAARPPAPLGPRRSSAP